jgi:hypothetical protein
VLLAPGCPNKRIHRSGDLRGECCGGCLRHRSQLLLAFSQAVRFPQQRTRETLAGSERIPKSTLSRQHKGRTRQLAASAQRTPVPTGRGRAGPYSAERADPEGTRPPEHIVAPAGPPRNCGPGMPASRYMCQGQPARRNYHPKTRLSARSKAAKPSPSAVPAAERGARRRSRMSPRPAGQWQIAGMPSCR